MTVYRDGHVAYADTLTRGGMTAEESALGFPLSVFFAHTEARAARSILLQLGGTMIVDGLYPPCPSCKGAMNKAASESGATIHYLWEQNIWTAGGR